MSLEAHIFVATALLALLYVPGRAFLSVVSLDQLDNPWLCFPLALSAGFVLSAIPSALVMGAGLGMHAFALLLGLWIMLWLAIALIAHLYRPPQHPKPRNRQLLAAQAATALLGLVGALSAATQGTGFRSDSAIHASIIEKLIFLPGVRFNEIGLIADGRPVDSAILPTWHQLLALSAWPFEYPGLVAMWCAGAAVAFVVPWSAAALGYAAMRTHSAAVLCAALITAWALVGFQLTLATPSYLAYPGNFNLYVMMPPAFALIVQGLRPDKEQRRRAAAGLCLIVLATAILHLTYLYYIAIAGAAIALVIAFLRPQIIRLLVWPAAATALTALICLLIFLPLLSEDEQFNRGSARDLQSEQLGQWLSILDGKGHGVRAEYFLEIGGLALAGLAACLLLVPLARRIRVEALALGLGPLLALALFARSDMIANAVAGLGSYPPIPRTYKVIPWLLPIPILCAIIGHQLGRWRVLSALAAMGMATGLILLGWYAPGELRGRDMPVGNYSSFLPPWTFDAALYVLALQIVLLVIWVHLRPRLLRSSQLPPHQSESERHPPDLVSPILAALMSAACLIFGIYYAAQTFSQRPDDLRAADGLFYQGPATPQLLQATDDLAPGSVVLAEEGLGMRLAAVQPIYLTHLRKQAFSSAKRREDYIELGFETNSDEQILKYLNRYAVDAVLLPLPQPLRPQMRLLLDSSDDWAPIEIDGETVGWQRLR